MINIATDGACKGNPGPGGWGVAIFKDDERLEGYCGGNAHTTNNRMELTAFIESLRDLHHILDAGEEVTFWLDSTYVLKGVTEWMPGWMRKNWTGVKNVDLWEQIVPYLHLIAECDLRWCKGHAGNIYNLEADDLANLGVEEL